MKIIGKASNSDSWHSNVLTDGHSVYLYEEIPVLLERLEKYFKVKDIGLKGCLALGISNSVLSVVILIFLLKKGHSFLLFNSIDKTYQEVLDKALIPNFCRYIFMAKTFANNESKVDLNDPERGLKLIENVGWVNNVQSFEDTDQKIYFQTSGSTGKPKLVVHQQANLLENALNCAKRLKLESKDRIAIPVPIFHMYGLGAALLPGVMVGASIDLQKGANLLRYLQREKEFSPNVAFMTPAFCESLLRGRRSQKAYKLTVAAGDRMKEDTFANYESRFGRLVKLYGSTEMGAIAASDPSDPSELRAKTVGMPMPGVKLRVDSNEPASIDEVAGVAELLCHHTYGFEGYVDQSGMLKIQDMKTDWFRTKDLGRIGEDGYVEVLGRCDHSVNRNGLLVLLSDVEKEIEAIEGIESVTAIVKGESQRGKGIIAYCVLTENATTTEADIRAACFERLPRHAIPDHVAILESLPMLPNGKVNRQKLIKITDESLVVK